MRRTNYKAVLDTITQEVKSIADEKVKSILTPLPNLAEALIDDNDQLRAENNRLKGEQGKPIKFPQPSFFMIIIVEL